MNTSEDTDWHYLKGKVKPPKYWTHIGFNASGWEKGKAAFGYGNREAKTVLNDMRGNYKKIHVRREFQVAKPDKINKMKLSVLCDGAFSAYLNGIEVIRNTSGPAVHNNEAEQLDISGFTDELLPGLNVLSVQCENDDINSEDFSFNPHFEVQ